MEEKKEIMVKVPIEWYVSEDIKSQFATNMIVQHTAEEFLISFFEMEQPLLLGNQDEIKSKLETIGTIRAKCIARIVVTPQRIKNLLKHMTKNFEAFIRKEEKKVKNNAFVN